MTELTILIGILAIFILFDVIVRIWHSLQYKLQAGKAHEENLKSIKAYRNMYHESMQESFDMLDKSVNEYLKGTQKIIEKYYRPEENND